MKLIFSSPVHKIKSSFFKNLIKYIEKGEIKPLVAKTYPLKEIRKAQEDFLLKKHVGKLVLLP